MFLKAAIVTASIAEHSVGMLSQACELDTALFVCLIRGRCRGSMYLQLLSHHELSCCVPRSSQCHAI